MGTEPNIRRARVAVLPGDLALQGGAHGCPEEVWGTSVGAEDGQMPMLGQACLGTRGEGLLE